MDKTIVNGASKQIKKKRIHRKLSENLPGVLWLPVVGRFAGTSGVPPDENSRPV